MFMPIAGLTTRQHEIIRRCLRTAADEPDVFPEREFHAIFGLTRIEIASVADGWPNINGEDQVAQRAINNALNNVLGYPHDWQDEWAAHFDFSREELSDTLAAWSGRKPGNYFEGML